MNQLFIHAGTEQCQELEKTVSSLTPAASREEDMCTLFIIHRADLEKQMLFTYLENSVKHGWFCLFAPNV